MLLSLAKRVFFPLQEKLKGHRTLACLAELEASQWLPPAELGALQWRKLEALLRHAYRNVPYYRTLFDQAGLRLESIQSPGDLSQIPYLTKDIIRAHTDALRATDVPADQITRFNTGGSTGTPLVFYIDKRRVGYDVAANLRAKRWWGIEMGDREVVFWGSPIEVDKQGFGRELRDRLLNTKLFSAFNMNDERMRTYAETIRRYRPRHLFGYPSTIALFCQFARANGFDLTGAGVRVAFVTAEVLYTHQRELIEQTFHCRVANQYGARDGGFIAHECPQGGMHVTAENVYLEFIPTGGGDAPGGEIVVTHLDNYGFPFIRYKMGDIGAPSDQPCGCGRGLPCMRVVEGRVTDFIVTPSGRIMHGLSLIYVLRDRPGIDKFKIIQRATDSVVIRIIKNAKYQADDSEQIVRQIQERMGARIQVALEFVEDIPAERSGKFRYVVSEVVHEYITRPNG